MKKILLWGAPRKIRTNQSFNDQFKDAGSNFGNTLIGYGVERILQCNDLIDFSDIRSPEDANERCSHIVIPAANFLWKDFDFGYMADFIEKTNLPVTVIGLGAQTHDRSTVSRVHPNTVRLVKIIAERGPSLGVRGFYTCEVLASLGILNTTALGCPSLYSNGVPYINPNFKDSLDESKVSVNFSRQVAHHSFSPTNLRLIESKLLELSIKSKSSFVAQDEIFEILLSQNEVIPEKQKELLLSYFSPLNEGKDIISFFQKQTHHFTDISAWINYAKKQSCSIGSRLHGNIIFLINGIPAINIVHDSRTLEVATLIGAPVIHVNSFQVDGGPNRLVDYFDSVDFSLFNSNMAFLYKKAMSFFNEHSLPTTLDLTMSK